MDAGETLLRIRVSRGQQAKQGPAGREMESFMKAAVHRAGRSGAGKTQGIRLGGRGGGVVAAHAGRSQRVTV